MIRLEQPYLDTTHHNCRGILNTLIREISNIEVFCRLHNISIQTTDKTLVQLVQ